MPGAACTQPLGHTHIVEVLLKPLARIYQE
jgi:hypothetical protein